MEENNQTKNQIPLFTVIPANEKAKNYILMQAKTIDNLEEIIKRLKEENEGLKKRLSKYEIVEEILIFEDKL